VRRRRPSRLNRQFLRQAHLACPKELATAPITLPGLRDEFGSVANSFTIGQPTLTCRRWSKRLPVRPAPLYPPYSAIERLATAATKVTEPTLACGSIAN